MSSLWMQMANDFGKADLLLLFLAALVLVLFLRRNPNGKASLPFPLPPGPRGLPLVGNLPFIEPNLHVYFTRLAKTYGPVFRLCLGYKPLTVVSSPLAARELFKDQDVAFANHDVPAAFRFCIGTAPDVLWSPYGPTWQKLRKITATHLLNSRSMEATAPLRRKEVRLAVAAVWERAKAGEAMELRETLFQMALNTTTMMLWGERVDGEGEGRMFRRTIEKILNHFIMPNVADFYPVVAPLDPQRYGRKVKRFQVWMDEYLNRIVQSRETSLSEREVEEKKMPKDLLEKLLELMHEGDPLVSSFSVADLRHLFASIIGASTDNNTTTIEWAMAELLYEPDRMRKAQHELDTVVGRDRPVEESDIPQLRYLGAVVKETRRCRCSSPTAQAPTAQQEASQSPPKRRSSSTRGRSTGIRRGGRTRRSSSRRGSCERAGSSASFSAGTSSDTFLSGPEGGCAPGWHLPRE